MSSMSRLDTKMQEGAKLSEKEQNYIAGLEWLCDDCRWNASTKKVFSLCKKCNRSWKIMIPGGNS